MRRELAVGTVMLAAGCLLLAEVQQRARERRDDRKRVERALSRELKRDAWMGDGVSLVESRLSAGEVPVMVTVLTCCADGLRLPYHARPGDTGLVVTVRRAGR